VSTGEQESAPPHGLGLPPQSPAIPYHYPHSPAYPLSFPADARVAPHSYAPPSAPLPLPPPLSARPRVMHRAQGAHGGERVAPFQQSGRDNLNAAGRVPTCSAAASARRGHGLPALSLQARLFHMLCGLLEAPAPQARAGGVRPRGPIRVGARGAGKVRRQGMAGAGLPGGHLHGRRLPRPRRCHNHVARAQARLLPASCARTRPQPSPPASRAAAAASTPTRTFSLQPPPCPRSPRPYHDCTCSLLPLTWRGCLVACSAAPAAFRRLIVAAGARKSAAHVGVWVRGGGSSCFGAALTSDIFLALHRFLAVLDAPSLLEREREQVRLRAAAAAGGGGGAAAAAANTG